MSKSQRAQKAAAAGKKFAHITGALRVLTSSSDSVLHYKGRRSGQSAAHQLTESAVSPNCCLHSGI